MFVSTAKIPRKTPFTFVYPHSSGFNIAKKSDLGYYLRKTAKNIEKKAKLMQPKAGFAHLIGGREILAGRIDIWRKGPIRLQVG